MWKAVPKIAWGKYTRVSLDVGCGVASFGGYLFERDVLTMSFAPKDEHDAQIQFALERGIPAISAVMGTKRLQFPSNVFDRSSLSSMPLTFTHLNTAWVLTSPGRFSATSNPIIN